MSELMMSDIIDEKVIEACELDGACNSGLTWLRSKPRTFADLRAYFRDWYQWLANHAVPVPVLELLAKDSHVDVRRGVAKNQNTPVPVLELLAKDSHVDVRRGVAENQNTPVPVLEGTEVSS